MLNPILLELKEYPSPRLELIPPHFVFIGTTIRVKPYETKGLRADLRMASP